MSLTTIRVVEKVASRRFLDMLLQRMLLLTCVVFASNFDGAAQENLIQPLSDFKTTLAKQNNAEAIHLDQLLNGYNAAAYIEKHTYRPYSDAPVCLYIDSDSFSKLNLELVQSKRIEIITIRITDVKMSQFDLEALSNFPNLKYIYFLYKAAPAAGLTVINQPEHTSVFWAFIKPS